LRSKLDAAQQKLVASEVSLDELKAHSQQALKDQEQLLMELA